MQPKVINYLKQLPWLGLFWLIMILSRFMWDGIWNWAIESNATVAESVNFDIINSFWSLYYYILIPVLLAAISYVNVRLNGFSLLFLFLLPLVHYWNGLSGIWEHLQYVIQPDQSVVYAQSLTESVAGTFQQYNQLILIALGAALLAQHHRERKAHQQLLLSKN